MSIRFDDRVAIVTGAGNGLGRTHALGLAARGAKVVVNDLGGARDGTGGSLSAAETVVEEIKAAGGEAIANGANVTKIDEVETMVKEAMDTWGRVDILVNNAGILRDKTFLKMDLADFQMVIDVHLMGSVNCTKAVWEIMREQGYGRIAMTTSSSGLYGNFGQANYGAAKLGLVGFMNTLHLEGAKYDIRVNALSPVAGTRMTEDLMPQEVLDVMTPESVSAGLLYLVSEDGPKRTILAAGAGGFACARITETQGIYLKPDEQTPENVAANWDAITNPDGAEEYTMGGQQSMKFLAEASKALGLDLKR
ncbi:MAG: SDR family oxidoreductase [Robiginitomaculum sp.]|nr:SDR family oxidoreductase [Robiginitomaculum sp.]MDQ7078286.1 SDR family oxidoreductase [Robiginitomaculum sp.]